MTPVMRDAPWLNLENAPKETMVEINVLEWIKMKVCDKRLQISSKKVAILL